MAGNGQEEAAQEAGQPLPDPALPLAPLPPASGPPAARPPAARPRAPGDRALGLRLFLVLLTFAIIAAGFSLKIKPLSLPVVIVAEIEERLNLMSEPVLPGARVSLGGIELMLGEDWAPVFLLQDLRVLQGAQSGTALALPEARMVFDPAAMLKGQLLPRRLQISGAHLELRRDEAGRIDLLLGQGSAPALQNLGEVFDRIEAALGMAELSRLEAVEFSALSLSLYDQRLRKRWELGDGRLVAENRKTQVAAELSISFLDLAGQNLGAARALMTVVSDKGTGTARIRAEVFDIPAPELAAQHPVLAWLGALDAPISGQFSVQLQRSGISALEGQLTLGAGALQPGPQAAPIAFTKAGLTLSYDRADGRLQLSDLSLQSVTARARARGQVYLLDAAGQTVKGVLTGQNPAAFLAQLSLTDVAIDPEGLFVAPLQFSHGALDLRLTAEPFKVEIGQFTLGEGTQEFSLYGTAQVGPQGWSAALDMRMNEVTVQRLVQLWPLRLVPKTRAWVAKNLMSGVISDLNGALRLTPGAEPLLHLDYDFAGAQIRYMPQMPLIDGGAGYSVIDGKVNTVVLTSGTLTPPQGGVIDIAGSSMRVPDIYAVPVFADISLRGRGPAEAMLSVIDQKPFEYLTKAQRPVALGSGEAVVSAQIHTALAKGVKPGALTFSATARVAGFDSSVLVPGRRIVIPDLTVSADKTGMTAGGVGTLDGLPFDAVFTLPFAAGAGPGQITGTAEVSERAVQIFDLGLPAGMLKGASSGNITITLPKGAPPQLRLTSDLQGSTLAIPQLGWSKPKGNKARLEVEARLSVPPYVSLLALSSADLTAKGTVRFRGDGRLDLAQFGNVTLGDWLDGAVEISGTAPLSFAFTSGSIDFRAFPGADQRSAGAGGVAANAPLSLRLSEFRVTDSISLSDFRGDFTLGSGGARGTFSADLGGAVPVTGGVAPSANGTAIRVVSIDAGAALQAAGIFDSARGGSLDLRLTPRAQNGIYDGSAEVTDLRVKNDNVLADLLNAISVIGLLEQLNGSGIVFSRAEADFVLAPGEVTVLRSSAVGASMGVSMEGTYQTAGGILRMGGVISPIYLLNGIGAFLTRQGEGFFGFTYRLNGTADAPQVGVNPLSILTPGMFRDIFRMPAPVPEAPAP